MSGRRRTPRGPVLRRVALTLLVVALAACGEAGTGAPTPSPTDGVEPDVELTIVEPDQGARVSVPVTLEFDTNVELGAGGEHHITVYVDGLEVGAADRASFQLTDLEPGDHAIHVSLVDESGDPAGAEDEITVTVVGGATPT